MMVTLDGFFEGPNREIDWHVVDEEFNEYANDRKCIFLLPKPGLCYNVPSFICFILVDTHHIP